MKKIKITESQLKSLMERRHSFINQETNEEESVEIETNEEESEPCEECQSEEEKDQTVNESIEKLKTSFKRFF